MIRIILVFSTVLPTQAQFPLFLAYTITIRGCRTMFLLLNDSNQFYDVELRREAVLSKAAEIEGDRI